MRLSSHIRALLLLFGTYLPPPTSLSAAANIPAATRSTRVPQEVLTDAVIEEIKTRCCFVGDVLDMSDIRMMSPSGDDQLDTELPPSDPAMSESEFSRVSADMDSNFSSQHAASSGFSVVSHSQVPSSDHPRPSESHLQGLATLYTRHSTATDLHMRVDPPASQQTGTGRGTLIIPGWIRERAAEVLFEGGDVDESSVAEVILDSLLKVRVITSFIPQDLTTLSVLFMRSGAGRSSENARFDDPCCRWYPNATRVHPTAALGASPCHFRAFIVTSSKPSR